MFHRLSPRAALFSVPRLIGLAIGIAVGLSLVIGVSLVAAQRGEPGDPPGATSYQGCVNSYTGVLRILGAGEQCQDHETPIQLGGSGGDAALEERIADLEAENETLQNTVTTQQGVIDDLVQQNTDQQTAIDALEENQVQIPACLTTEPVGGQERADIVFDGCNVHVRSGAGETDAPVNGLGNLIIGYNEADGDSRTGSHNLVVGQRHSYTSFSGLVAGYNNTISGESSSVSGGSNNTASNSFSSVSGGSNNTASGGASSVNGGTDNTASGGTSSVSSGIENTASGPYSSVSGGALNTASEHASSVSGGYSNTASGPYSSVSGGQSNMASAGRSSVSGGYDNTASGGGGSVSGGENNIASEARSSVSGGYDNTASGAWSSVSGGNGRSVLDSYDWRGGEFLSDG